jgi:hypothetical protein
LLLLAIREGRLVTSRDLLDRDPLGAAAEADLLRGIHLINEAIRWAVMGAVVLVTGLLIWWLGS